MKRLLLLIAVITACTYQSAFAQGRTISGKVTSSEDQQTVPGVSVAVKGTTVGTLTDMEGNFKLNVPADAKTIVFSFVGMKTKEVELGTTDVVDVVLDPDILKLDEVVVTAVAIERQKRSLGYATEQVKSDELTQGENNNLIGAIQGKVSGVNITSLSGAPGSSQRIVIRGGSSITRSNQALIVVDGIPLDNSNFRTQDPSDPLHRPDDLNDQVDYGNRGNDINPDDIESISVLKGPAATALYGSRASNGALIITTKKGKRTVGGRGKMDVTFNSNVTFSSPLKLPDFQTQYGQGDVDNVPDDHRENFSWGLPFNGNYRAWGQEINGQQRIKPYSAIPDNVRDFFDLGVAYNNHISFSGGTDKSAYFLSFGALNSKGIVPTSEYDKYNIMFNGSSELANHFTTSISLNYSSIASTLPTGGQTNSIYDQLIQTPRDIPIVDGKNQDDIFNKYDDITHTYGFYAAYTINPYFILNNFKNTNDVDRLYGGITVSYNGWSWLTISDRFGGDVYGDRRYEKWKKYDYIPLDESGLYSATFNKQTYQGKYSEDLYNFTSYNNDLMLTFKRQLTTDISSSLLIGQNVRQSLLTNTFAQTNPEGGLVLDGYYNLDNSNGTPFARNTTTESRVLGYYGDLNFGYKNLVFLDITGRSDISSTLPSDNRSYFYPSFSGSFVFSELFSSKLKDNTWTYGKLRASYAKVGNSAPEYITTNSYGVTAIDGGFGSTHAPFGTVPAFSVSDQAGNPDIKPEFTTAFEVGTELGFFKDRLSLDFSYYQNNSKDQIIPLPLPPSSGYTSKYINTGEVQNKGIELGMRGTPILSKSGFKLELYGTYTKNTNEVVSLYQGVEQLALGGTSRTAIVAQVGKPYGAFYAVDLMHTDQSDPSSPVVVDSSTGMPLTTANLVYAGNYQPDYIASFGMNIKYKGFTLGVLFDRKSGGKFYSRTKDVLAFDGGSKETTENGRQDYVWPNSVYQRSTDAGYSTNTTPFHPYDYFTNVIPEARHIIDASYTKLREVSLSYEFPAKWLSKTPFGSASLAIFGNNLVIWTPDENQYADPEQNSSGSSNTQGFEFSSNPSQRNYGFDLKFTF